MEVSSWERTKCWISYVWLLEGIHIPYQQKGGSGGGSGVPNHMIVNMEASIWNHMNTIEHHKNDREPIWFSNMITTEPCNVTGMMVRYRVTSANGMNFSGLVNCYILSRYISETNITIFYTSEFT